MQAFEAISAAIITVILADTGTGGMFNSSTPLLTSGAVYVSRVPDNMAFPYLVLHPVAMGDDSAFSADIQTIVIQFSVFGKRDGIAASGTTAGEDLVAVNAALDRLHTLIQRQTFTVSGWGTAVGRRVGGAQIDDDVSYQRTTDYSFLVQRV